MSTMRAWTPFGLACLVLGGCRAPLDAPPRPAPVDETAQPSVLDEIAALEDARELGGGRLIDLAQREEVDVRGRATRALGRLWFPECGGEVTAALVDRLSDYDASVRAEAAFALGMRGDPSAAEALIEHLDVAREPEATVRARSVEALSKLARQDTRARVLAALDDDDPRVRLEAACGAHRWPATEIDAADVNLRLVEHLARESDREVIVYTLFALERRKATEAASAFVERLRADDARERLFAARGLAALVARKEGSLLDVVRAGEAAEALVGALESDADWRVACEALPVLARDVAHAEKLFEIAGRPNAHVRRAAWNALAAIARTADRADLQMAIVGPAMAGGKPVVPAAMTTGDEPTASGERSSAVRAAAREAQIAWLGRAWPIAQRLQDSALRDEAEDVIAKLRAAATDERDAWVRAGMALGMADLPADVAVELLKLLAADSEPVVAQAALEALGKHKTDGAHAALLATLEHQDNGVKLAAVTALLEHELGEPDVQALTRVFDGSKGDGASEIRFNALRAVAKTKLDSARSLLLRALSDSEPFVRRVARDALAASWPDAAAPSRDVAHAESGGSQQPSTVLRSARNRRIAIETNRGTMTFELFADEAPTHVHNLLTLAARKHYDGLTFHRVVADFVIQGGDYRGDGNGGTTWRVERQRELHARGEIVPADSLRHEIGPRKFVRGSLGMPRNDDPDSGGSQIFVCHRETPHLDGRYTNFGQLLGGFDVLDAIEVGDRIERVTEVDD